MAKWQIKNVELKGVAACVPKSKLETMGIGLFSPDEREKFLENVGIRSRRVAAPDTCASDLCYQAAESLLIKLGWNREEVGALIFVSITADYRSPMTSCILQDRLGLSKECFTMDIPLACCGYLHGLTVLGNLMATGNVKKGLLLAGDTCFQMSSSEDKSRYPIFGDAGTASAYEYNMNAGDILSYSYSDGSGYKAIITPHSGFRYPVTPASFIMKEISPGIKRASVHGVMDGMEVFSFAISKAPALLKKVLQENNIDKDYDVDFYLMHQANLLINNMIIKKTKLDPKKVPSNIEEYGNTSCAAIPMLMVTRIKEALRSKTLNLMLLAFGVGLTWGCAKIQTKNVVCLDLMEI